MSTAEVARVDPRVAGIALLRPRLANTVEVMPRRDGGVRWYLLHDSLGGSMLRLDATAWSFVGRLDGLATVGEALACAGRERGGLATLDEALAVLARLRSHGFLSGDGERSIGELETVARRSVVQRRRARAFGLLSMRLPLIDPDAWLARVVARTRRFEHRFLYPGLLAFATVGAAGVLWQAPTLLAETAASVERVSSWWVFLCTFVVLKTVHECAHGFTLKRYGGSVHEAGVALLVLLPVPYVDASSSWRLGTAGERWRVAAAGMLVELLVAAIALPVWVSSETGAVHDAARTIVVTAAIGTFLFNANPLLKFDGYYLLQDLLGLPNLASRSTAAWAARWRRHVLGNRHAALGEATGGVEIQVLLWGALALPFRVVVALAIAAWLDDRVGVVGWLVGMLALFGLARPALRALRDWAGREHAPAERARVASRVAVRVVVPLLVIALVPLPSAVTADGIVWMPESGRVHAPFDGRIVASHRAPGSTVAAGEPLLTLDSAVLDRDLAVIDGELAGIDTRRVAMGRGTAVEREAAAAERRALLQRRSWVSERRRSRTVRAAIDGVFVPEHPAGMIGRRFVTGERLGLVVDTRRIVVRLVLPADRLAFELDRVRGLEVRLADDPTQVHAGGELRERRRVDNRLPSAALGVPAGGRVAVATADADGLASDRPLRHLELALDADVPTAGVGQRAWVRIRLPRESLARRALRGWRQLFLDRLPF